MNSTGVVGEKASVAVLESEHLDRLVPGMGLPQRWTAWLFGWIVATADSVSGLAVSGLAVGVLAVGVLAVGVLPVVGNDFRAVDEPVALERPWRFTEQAPHASWITPDFDDSEWMESRGGFGTPGTPGARIGTLWDSAQIWLRQSVELDAIPTRFGLMIHHDEDAEVYLNGQLIAELPGYTTAYRLLELDPTGRSAAVVGVNCLAIHCRQTRGGQFIDAHLVDLDNPPVLLPIQRADAPFRSELITPWGESLDTHQPWPEYPRPAFQRGQWVNLNGPWDYEITSDQQREVPAQWRGKIVVPFGLESKLSGVQQLLKPDQALWYRRTFEFQRQPAQRLLLNFEAVDYQSEVWVNGTPVGSHRGGHTPFSFDLTDVVRDGSNEIVVRVLDRTEMMQLRGKQALEPQGIWYTQVSGIWQTVWLETVPDSYLERVLLQPNIADGSVEVTPFLAGTDVADLQLKIQIQADGQVVAQSQRPLAERHQLRIPQPKLWSPDSPYLYDVICELVDSRGQVGDRVQTYVGLRSVGKMRDDRGHWRLTLNGEPLFHWGPLDQGWWPDGLLTPPSDKAMQFDVDFLKQAGFNMIRKHIKVEPRRYYEYCDRIGMLVWQDQVSGGPGPPWTRLAANPQDAEWPDRDHQQFLRELDRMILVLENHPSIVMWVPFNEAWGQHRTLEVGRWTVQRDPTRLVNIASGGNFWPIGDVVDHHEYPHPDFPFHPNRDRDYVMVVGEFGGHGLPVKGHLWNPEMDNWGYGGLPQNSEEYLERYEQSLQRLARLRDQGIAAGVYTQTTDVEGEINGLMTYDRKVIKIPAARLRQLHQQYGFTEN